MEQNTLVNSIKVKDMDLEYADGQVEMYTTVSGKKILKRAMDTRDGLMERNIMENTKMIESLKSEILILNELKE